MWIRYFIILLVVVVQLAVYSKVKVQSDAINIIKQIAKADVPAAYFLPTAIDDIRQGLTYMPESSQLILKLGYSQSLTDEKSVQLLYQTFPVLPVCINNVVAKNDCVFVQLLLLVHSSKLFTLEIVGRGEAVKISRVKGSGELFKHYK